MKTYPYKNLVFKGGGVKGIAYVGALKALEDACILPQITGFAGTSAGAITAAMGACRISSDALNTFLSTTNYEKFEDTGGFFSFLNDIARHFGAYEGDYFLNDWFKVFLTQQNIDPEITFAGVLTKFGTTLKVFATDLNKQTIQEFSPKQTPNVQIALAVRASMSIPMFFRAWQFPDSQPNDHIYVDGGVMYNYPIDAFDKDETSPDETLGFFLTNLNPLPPPPPIPPDGNGLTFGVSDLELYIKSLFESLMNSQNLMVMESGFEEARTVQVNDFGISATDFGIKPDKVKELYTSGLTATQKFLSKIEG